jgi:hypothetical protein
MIPTKELILNREVNNKSVITTLIAAILLALIIWLIRWELPKNEEKEQAFIEVMMDNPLIEEPEVKDSPDQPKNEPTQSAADLGNNANGVGDKEPRVAGTPGEASGDESKDPRTPDTKSIASNNDGGPKMPTEGNNPRATRLPGNNNPPPPTGNTTQGNAPRRPKTTLGPLNGQGNGTGGNGNVDNGYSSQGNNGTGGNAGRPDGTPGGRGTDLGSGGNINLTDDVDEEGTALFKAYFNKNGQCIRVDRVGGTVTITRQINRAKQEIMKERVAADPNGPNERFKRYQVKFKKDG